MGPLTGQTGAGFGGRVATGFLTVADVVAAPVAVSVVLSGRAARVVSCAAAAPEKTATAGMSRIDGKRMAG